MTKKVYLAGGSRTATGGFCGAYENTPAPVLGSVVIKAALQRANIPPAAVEEVIFVNVLSGGIGQNGARQAALGAGLNPAVGASTVNKLCGSGLKTVMQAAQAIQCSDISVAVAGGMENMSRAPYLLEKARTGYRMGNGELFDSLLRDGLWDIYSNLHMGVYGDRCAQKYGFSRQEQDDYSVESFRRAQAAAAQSIFAREIVPVEVHAGKDVILVKEDETLKKFNEEKLRKLRPAFGKDGTVTAGNA